MITCSRELNTYLSNILGQARVPLSYVVRESEAPDYTIESQPHYDFYQFSINFVPLTGLTYKTDASKLHQLIHGFVKGETPKTWINPKEKKQDVRLDYLSLLSHYGIEGNKAGRTKEAEALWTSLIYNNEISMSSEKFL